MYMYMYMYMYMTFEQCTVYENRTTRCIVYGVSVIRTCQSEIYRRCAEQNNKDNQGLFAATCLFVLFLLHQVNRHFCLLTRCGDLVPTK